MDKGFILGKFYPFHKGHEGMIRFALEQCKYLSVLVCCSNTETVPSTLRKKWIEETFCDTPNIEVLTFDYDESQFPNTSESSREVSEIWSTILKHFFPDYNKVITSEPYGYYIAEYMNIKHIIYDMDRTQTRVAATKIRNNLFSYWNFLPNAVKSDMALKVVILGSESTGKTTLTDRLSQHYKCTAVFEAGRDLIPDSNNFSVNDLYLVADEHAKRIKMAETADSALIIIDTDIHITKSYGRFAFGENLNINENIDKANKADLYLYLNNDVEFVQDGTRMSEAERNRLDEFHRQTIKDHNIEIVEIAGNWDERFEKAVLEIDKLLKKGKKYFPLSIQ